MAVDTTIALITLADAKAFLKIATGTTSEDSVVSDLVNECSVWINGYCGRRFIYPGVDYTEYYNGTNERQLHLNQWPIKALTSVYMDVNRAWTSDTLIDSGDLILDSDAGILTLWNTYSKFYPGVGNVRVIYSAGYTHNSDVPYDLKLACKKLVSWKYFADYSQRRTGISSESIGDRTISYTEKEMLSDVKNILDHYRRIAVG